MCSGYHFRARNYVSTCGTDDPYHATFDLGLRGTVEVNKAASLCYIALAFAAAARAARPVVIS